MSGMIYSGMARVLAGGAILLPLMVRNRLGLRASDSLIFTAEDGAIVARKFRESETCYNVHQPGPEGGACISISSRARG